MLHPSKMQVLMFHFHLAPTWMENFPLICALFFYTALLMGHILSRMHITQGLPMNSLWPAEYISQVHWDYLRFIVIKDSGQVSAHSSQSVVSGNNKATELANTPLHHEFIALCTQGYDKYSCQAESSVLANFIFNL